MFDVERFLEEDPGGPVVMLNLLRFRPGGREWYLEHGVTPQDTAAQVLYVGEGGTSLAGEPWDMVVLVRYPSRRAFAAVANLHADAVTDAVLQPTRPL